jgi:hypothetical protein
MRPYVRKFEHAGIADWVEHILAEGMRSRSGSAHVVEIWGAFEGRGVACSSWGRRARDLELVEELDGGGLVDDGEDAELTGAFRAFQDVDVERAAHQQRPVNAWGRGDERAGIQAFPVVHGKDVGRE